MLNVEVMEIALDGTLFRGGYHGPWYFTPEM